jgi:hypothetical protein
LTFQRHFQPMISMIQYRIGLVFINATTSKRILPNPNPDTHRLSTFELGRWPFVHSSSGTTIKIITISYHQITATFGSVSEDFK